MNSRLELHNLLLSIAGPNVYYQPPSNVVYPCIKYTLNKIDNQHANDVIYNQNRSYLLTIMSRDPDEIIVDKISKLPKCSFDRKFINENIHHTTFILYY